MAINYSIKDRLIYTTVEGTITTAEVCDYLHKILYEGLIVEGTIEMVNFSSLQELVVNSTDLDKFRTITKDIISMGLVSTIGIMTGIPQDVRYLLEVLFKAAKLEVHIFESEREAEAFLSSLSLGA